MTRRLPFTEQQATAALRRMREQDPNDFGTRFPDLTDSMRRTLKKAGWIETRRPSVMSSNRHLRWHITAEGRAALQEPK
jgi:hypothetical protein